MSSRARRWTFAAVAILVIALVIGLRALAPPPLPASVPLSTGKYRVRYLHADVGKLNYSSDDQLRKFLRPRLPVILARKLGDPINAGFTSGQNSIGKPPLVLLFQLLTPADTAQGTTETVFDRIEFPESSDFVFREEIRGYSSAGNGTSLHDVPAFPRRERDLHFRLYETGGQLLMERTIPNPGYQPNVPVWTPVALPQSKSVDELKVTLKSLLVREPHRFVKPEIEVESSDKSWLNPVVSHQWADATGNVGGWLSPFEPAWTLHLTLRRRGDAEFRPQETWKLDPAAMPVEPKLVTIDREKIVDGLKLRVRYVAPAGEIDDTGGVITITPPRNPGMPGMSISSGTTSKNGKMVSHNTVECGVPFVRLDHEPLPPGVELICDVRDQDGELLNRDMRPSRNGFNYTQFHAVIFKPRPETKTVQLEVRVNRPREVEFVVEPPVELREKIMKKP